MVAAAPEGLGHAVVILRGLCVQSFVDSSGQLDTVLALSRLLDQARGTSRVPFGKKPRLFEVSIEPYGGGQTDIAHLVERFLGIVAES